jgi:hypothetical protein
MKSGQNAPPTTRTITTSLYQTSQDEPPVRENEKKKNQHKTPKPYKDSGRTATPESTGGNKISTTLIASRNYLHWYTPWRDKKYSIALEGLGGTTTRGGRAKNKLGKKLSLLGNESFSL